MSHPLAKLALRTSKITTSILMHRIRTLRIVIRPLGRVALELVLGVLVHAVAATGASVGSFAADEGVCGA